LALSWTLKIYIHPEPIPTETPEDLEKFFDIFISRASIGLAPGWLVIIVGVLYNLAVFFVAFSTKRLQHAASEVLPLENFDWHPFKQVSDWAEHNLKRRATFRRSKKARQRIRSIHKSES
ncbi:MAG TPA: hypothetical protein VNK26_05470, partial [Pyrinomonadaceae bacterium]|nr:hypothetical protein [Pyrinomonadaceae bacterium]